MKRILFMICFIILAAVSLFSQADLQPAAIVNLLRSEPITVRQLRLEVERMERTAGRSLNTSERLQVLEAMINERLVLQGAERERVSVTENELNNQLQQLRNTMAQQIQRNPTDIEFNVALRNDSRIELLADDPRFMELFRDQLRNQMITQKFLMAKKGSIINAITPPTDAEIIARFELERAQFVRPQTVRFILIQVPYGPDATSRTAARQLAERLHTEIGSSASVFDEVAARSQSPNSGFQAGDAGFLPYNREARNVIGSELLNAAFTIRQGEVSGIIEGVQGFQIIKVTENYALRIMEIDDIIQLGSRVTVRNYIGQAIMAEKQQAAVAQASQDLITELRAGRTVQIFERNLNW